LRLLTGSVLRGFERVASTPRCIELSKGAGSTSDRELAGGAQSIPACIEMTAPIRESTRLFAGYVVLDECLADRKRH
jgi:hypothetical protein